MEIGPTVLGDLADTAVSWIRACLEQQPSCAEERACLEESIPAITAWSLATALADPPAGIAERATPPLVPRMPGARLAGAPSSRGPPERA